MFFLIWKIPGDSKPSTVSAGFGHTHFANSHCLTFVGHRKTSSASIHMSKLRLRIKEAWCRSASAFQCMMNLNIPPQPSITRYFRRWRKCGIMFSVQRKRKIHLAFNNSSIYHDYINTTPKNWHGWPENKPLKEEIPNFLVSPSFFKWKIVVFGGSPPLKTHLSPENSGLEDDSCVISL